MKENQEKVEEDTITPKGDEGLISKDKGKDPNPKRDSKPVADEETKQTSSPK